MKRRRPRETAIIGMGCRLPGAPDLFAFWADAVAGRASTGSANLVVEPGSVGDVVLAALADAGVRSGALRDDRVEFVIGLGRGVDRSAVEGGVEDLSDDVWVCPGPGLSAVSAAHQMLIMGRRDLAAAVGVTTEGVGAVILKQRRDAELAGDRIYAVIKAIGTADVGEANGGPASRSLRAIRQAFRESRVDPMTVGLVAASRRPADQQVIAAAFPPNDRQSRMLVGVSSDGMDGLIRTALSLHHRTAPPTADDRLISPSADGFEILTSARPWIHGDPGAPRRAGVHLGGSAESCAHAILEEHAASADGMTSGALLAWDCEAFLLAADDRSALADQVLALRDRLQRIGPDRTDLKDLAFTLNTGRDPAAGKVRLGLVASSFDELMKRLESIEPCLRDDSCQRVRDARGLYFWQDPPGRQGDGTLAFLFPGEGSQYPGMLADLCPHFPELRAVLDSADRIALESGEAVPPSRHLFGASSSSSDAIWATDTAVTAVLSSQWGMFQVLSRLGLRPHAVVGHSSGELPALAAAGVLETERSLESALSRLAAIFRGLEAEGAIPQARLTAVAVGREQAEAACRAHGGGSVVVAIDNCPHQVVLAGPGPETQRVVDELRATGAMCEDLPFSRAYHTPAFAAVLKPLEAFYRGLEFHPPKTRVYSCSNAEPMPDDPAVVRRLALAQWTRTVAFRQTIEAMHRDGLRVFIDVGARGNLCGYVDDILRGKPAFAFAANLARRSGTRQLNNLVAALFAQGLPLDPTYLYARRRPRRLDMSPSPELKPPRSIDRPAAGTNGRTRPKRPAPAGSHPESEGGARGSSNGNGFVHHDERLSFAAVAPAVAAPDVMPPAGIGMLDEAASAVADEAMIGYLSTMNAFLKAQNDVMTAYFQSLGGSHAPDASIADAFPESGPWVGAIVAGEPGRWVESEFPLVGAGDPVAADHTLGGRRVSALDPSRKGLAVLPFFVMAEMLAQVGSLIAPAGTILDGLQDVQAHKWVGYESGSVLAMRGEREHDDPRRIRVALRHRTRSATTDPGEGRLVFEGVARFAEHRREPQTARPLILLDPKPSKFTAGRLYDEQWLFHGPSMRPLTELGKVDEEGISGTMNVLPLAPLLRPGASASFHTDPIVLDGFTQLLGCWGLDVLDQGDVIFPLRMGGLTIHGERPREGTPVACRIHVREIERHRVRVDAEMLHADGRVWLRVDDWQDWRFYWPSRYRDVFRAPDSVLIGEPLPLPGLASEVASAVWLEPPIDMARPVWRDVLERVQLAPEELSETLAAGGPETDRTQRLWGRIAAKEAVRRIWLERGEGPRFPADLVVRRDPDGRPRLVDLDRPGLDAPSIAIAHAEGVSAALAARDSRMKPGVGVVALGDRSDAGLTLGERELLARCESDEWAARLLAAKTAAGQLMRMEPADRAERIEASRIDFKTGVVVVRLPDGSERIVQTNRRKGHAWAWTLGAEVETS